MGETACTRRHWNSTWSQRVALHAEQVRVPGDSTEETVGSGDREQGEDVPSILDRMWPIMSRGIANKRSAIARGAQHANRVGARRCRACGRAKVHGQ